MEKWLKWICIMTGKALVVLFLALWLGMALHLTLRAFLLGWRIGG